MGFKIPKHALWFGQSWHTPLSEMHTPPGRGQLRTIIPMMPHRDVDALYEELVRKGANMEGMPVSHPWGLRGFRVRDGEGKEITFGQTFE